MMVVGMGMTAMLGIVGLGTETMLIYGVRDKLQQSLDAGALAAGQLPDAAGMADEATDVFLSNFFASGPNATLKEPGLDVVVVNDGERIQLAATAEYQTRILNVIGVDQIEIAGRSVVEREVRPTEVALVLDVTGSMKGDKITALRHAGGVLVDLLFGDVEEHPNLYMSVVPYTSTVNIGNQRFGWLAGYDSSLFDDDPQGWKGCVEARPSGGDVTDAVPSDQPFAPFYWASDIDNVYLPVDNTQAAENNGTGPNLGCGPEILPLTNVKATVRSMIVSGVDAPGLKQWHRGGTTSNLGMVWGWRTISPQWRGLWGNAERPLDYDESDTRKAVVILTDGENQFWPNLSASGQGESPGGSDYTAYGRLADLSAATGGAVQTLSDGVAELNARFLQVCDALKADGVDVFTITFGLNSGSQADTREVYRQCASKPEYYFNSPQPQDLELVFRNVGTKLSSVRIVE